MATVRRGHDTDIPNALLVHKEAPAFYGILCEVLKGKVEKGGRELAAEVAIAIQGIVDSRRKRDWPTMDDVLKDMQNDIDDYLFEMERSHGLKLATEEMDAIIERCLSIAKKLAGYNA
jgi:hypothetical protein